MERKWTCRHTARRPIVRWAMHFTEIYYVCAICMATVPPPSPFALWLDAWELIGQLIAKGVK